MLNTTVEMRFKAFTKVDIHTMVSELRHRIERVSNYTALHPKDNNIKVNAAETKNLEA